MKLSRRADRDIPTSGLLTNRFVFFFQTAFLKNARDIRNDSLLDLSVGHQVNRFQFVVLVERLCDFRKILTRERLAAGDDQNTQVGAECLADPLDVTRGHLELLPRLVVQFVCKEAVYTSHVTDRGDEDI